MDDLLADFVAETREMLEASGGEIVAWEADPSDRARLDSIFRFVHTVKGNCGFFDFPRLERLSHAAEDALAEVRAGRRQPDSALVSAVLAIIDRIGEMTDAIEAGGEFPEGGDNALIAALEEGEPEQEGQLLASEAPASEAAGDAAKGRPTPQPTQAIQRSIRLPVDLLDEVMKGVSDLVLARNDLARRLREGGNQPTLDGPFERLSTILSGVRDSTTRMRMQRLEHLFGSFPRLVRDLSNDLGKQVMVDFEGGDVELDREMVEMVRDPLTHIVRNAIDHGIEKPVDRLMAGKREIGLLRFAARQSGNQISLVISDDGNGIDTDRLAAKAVEAGLRTPQEIAAMDERAKLDLIFEPGLSTADQVSAVSGRGVGMDVVRANILKIGGSIEVASTPKDGTSFYLRLPLTLSMMSALTVETRGQIFALPRSFADEIAFARTHMEELARAGESQMFTYRGRRIPCIALEEVLFGASAVPLDWSRKKLLVIRLATGELFALGVDQVLDHEDVVVKPIAPAIVATGLYAGTTLLDDGRPMMLLDMPSIAAKFGLVTKSRSRSDREQNDGAETNGAASQATITAMLYRGLDGRRRAVRLGLVRRIETIERSAIDIEGDRAQIVIDERLITLIGHEGSTLPEGNCRLLRLSDGASELALIVSEVLDAIDLPQNLRAPEANSEYEGIALVEGHPIPLIDGHTLFARHDRPVTETVSPTCRLPEDSEWARKILEPLVIAAGYTVLRDEADDGDLRIVIDGDAVPSSETKTPLLHLRSDRDPRGASDASIYRYDREALMAALARLRRENAA
ncbi:MAG: chemotaxis protein CheA [Erythrobacter sp.]|nr:chemotaxis protein CheA [Erythrobacter sp.]